MNDIKEFYLSGADISVGDDQEFENKHPRKGGKFVKKGEQGGSSNDLINKREKEKFEKEYKAEHDRMLGAMTPPIAKRLGISEDKVRPVLSKYMKTEKGGWGAIFNAVKNELKDDGSLKVSDIKITEKDGEITAFAPEGVVITQETRKKMMAAIVKKHPDKKFDFSKVKVDGEEGIKAVEKVEKKDESIDMGGGFKLTWDNLKETVASLDLGRPLNAVENAELTLVKSDPKNAYLDLKGMYGKMRECLQQMVKSGESKLESQTKTGEKKVEAPKKFVDNAFNFINSPEFNKKAFESAIASLKLKGEDKFEAEQILRKWAKIEEKERKDSYATSHGRESYKISDNAKKCFAEINEKVLSTNVGDAAEWDESKHVRAKDGRFGKKAGEHGKKPIKGFVSETAYKQFSDAYNRAYNHFYENDDPREILYTDAFIKEMHEDTSMTPDFKAKLEEFAEKRQDPVSSDRELAAFWSAWSGVDPTRREPNALEKELGDIYKKRQKLWLNSGDYEEQKRLGQEYVKKYRDWALGAEESSDSSKQEKKPESKGAEVAKKIVGELDRYWQDRYAMLDEQGHSLINAVFEKVQTKQPQMLMKQSIMICEENQRYANDYSKKMSLMSTKTGLPVSELERMRDEMKDMLADGENFLHLENDSHVFEYNRSGSFNVMTKDQWYRSQSNDFLVRKAKELNVYVNVFKGGKNQKHWEDERNMVTSILAERSGVGK